MPYETPATPSHPDEGVHEHEPADESGHELEDFPTHEGILVDPDRSEPPL